MKVQNTFYYIAVCMIKQEVAWGTTTGVYAKLKGKISESSLLASTCDNDNISKKDTNILKEALFQFLHQVNRTISHVYFYVSTVTILLLDRFYTIMFLHGRLHKCYYCHYFLFRIAPWFYKDVCTARFHLGCFHYAGTVFILDNIRRTTTTTTTRGNKYKLLNSHISLQYM